MIRTYQIAPVALAAALALIAADVGAVQQPAHLPQGLELASSAPARPLRSTTWRTPKVSQRAWDVFRADVGGRWQVIWDDATDVPLRVFGTGTPAPMAVADASAALRHASDMLVRHGGLWARGAAPSDFVLAANEVHDGLRVVSFFQLHDGMRVLGGQVSFRFKNDRLIAIGSEALPRVKAKKPAAIVAAPDAERSARSYIEADFGPAAVTGGLEGPFVLPVVQSGGVAGYHTVVRLEVETLSAVGRWDVYLDAKTGAPVAREQRLRFATAALHLNTPVRQPQGERADFPAPFATITVDTVQAVTDELGEFTFADEGPVDGAVSLTGPFVQMSNAAGAVASPTFSFAPDATVVWSDPNNELVDAQLNTFVHTHRAKDYVRGINPDLAWLAGRLTAEVNINESCNAYYDGNSIHFYRSSGQCENTGRLADVVYHEFGHGVHDKSIILGAGQFDGALSEGVSDYLAATMTNDPGMGRGFFFSLQPLRHIDPEGGEYIWPDDVTGEVHQDGLIIAGALWDLRKLLVEKHGQAEGVAIADNLYYGAMRVASDIPSMFADVLTVDDDDGNLENGTPNVCEIVEAFGAHGLRPLDVVSSSLSVEPPTQEGYDVTVAVEGLFAQCENDVVASATVVWGLQRQATQQNSVPMVGEGPDLVGSIPPQLEGEVVRYRVEVKLGSGQTLNFPNNAADSMYQFFVGEVVPIYCTDFEADPFLEGWTHGLLDGSPDEGADDWQWGAPNGTNINGDPPSAFSGDNILGNDLGWGNFNGLYQPNKRNYADSPIIDASGHKNVRLQYRRWLNSEDAFFDKATVWVNNQIAWRNLASNNENDADVHHRDREWRFHDVDITKLRGEDGSIQVRFEMHSDAGLQFGGWSLDDFCVVAYEGDLPGANCGNGLIDAGEACDDGNVVAGDGCDAFCALEGDGDGATTETPSSLEISNGCACSVPGDASPRRGLAVLALGAAAALSRRRSRSR